jgi:signal transduction histidine kinase
MSAFQSVYQWLAGDGRYHTLVHCMGGDTLWIAITVALDFTVAAGYGLIALHWWRNQRHLPDTPAKRALGTMRNIFLFCGICGYLFIPVKMVWPAWRLYDGVMLVLAYYTWRYAWGAKDLKVIYSELGRSKQLADDLHESRQESQRKSFFLNAISHDLRTPLNGLLLQVNLAELGASTGDAETLKGSIRDIKASARAAADMLDSFLEYARLDAGVDRVALAEVDVAAAVRAAVTSFGAMAEQKGLYLRASAPNGLVIRSDRQRLERVLINLVSNAVKFTERGGVRVEVERERDLVRLHVIDTGVGIATPDQARVFDEFFQARNPERSRVKGFGLGLAIARRMARQLGGDLTCESSPGHGSRFTLTVPAVSPEPADQAGPTPITPAAPAVPGVKAEAVILPSRA